MRISSNSITKIIGFATEVMVFGFEDSGYQDVADALEVEQNIRTNTYSRPNIPVLFYDFDDIREMEGELITLRRCKAIIVSLIAENYRRSQEDLDLMPLIFCIEKETDQSHSTLDLLKLCSSHGELNNYTDQELRRCYKIFAETNNPELSKIILKTFKFVKLTKDANQKDLFHLSKLPPFWENDIWKKGWQERRAMKTKSDSKPEKFSPWREVLNERLISNHSSYFYKCSQSTLTETEDKSNLKLKI